MFRIIVGTAFVALGIYVAIITVQGAQSGVLMWPSKYEPHLWVHRITQPASFWIAAIAWTVMCGWILYAAIAEILFATRMPK
jgi:hypothetical protein